MKLLLALSLSMFASVSMACTDFTGSYVDENSDTYSIAQSGCAALVVNSQEGTETIITDGLFRVTEESEDVKISSAASFVGANLTIDGRIEYNIPMPPEVPTDMIPVRAVVVYTFDSAGNLLMEFSIYNSKNQLLGQTTQTHQKI